MNGFQRLGVVGGRRGRAVDGTLTEQLRVVIVKVATGVRVR